MLFIIISLSFILGSGQISEAEQSIINENRIYSDLISKQIQVGYLQDNWPFETMNKLSKRGDFLFWWVVKEDGLIYRADDANFIGTEAMKYFPLVSDTSSVYLDRTNGYGIIFQEFKVGQDKWVFWLGFSLNYVATRIQNIILSIALISVSGLVILTFGLYVAVKYLTNPIKRLRDTTNELANGNLDIKTDIRTDDEIGELASAFNQMGRSLKASRKAIEDYSKNLERKVKRRTKDLDAKIKELERRDQQIIKINEKLEKANAKLKELDKEKDEFISIAAHELKTPLTSIKGFAQLINNTEVMKDKKKMKYYLELIDRNTIRLYNLILDIVDSSRLSLGKIHLDIKEVDTNKIFDEVKINMGVIIQEKKIKSEFSIEKGIPNIKADPERLLQVIRNLIVNATHFTPEGGTISFKIYRKGSNVQFEVKDTGEGIPKSKQSLIFSKFYQADASLTRKVKGSGLGLSICKGLVNCMKGMIWFESEPGKGTTFYFTVPMKK